MRLRNKRKVALAVGSGIGVGGVGGVWGGEGGVGDLKKGLEVESGRLRRTSRRGRSVRIGTVYVAGYYAIEWATCGRVLTQKCRVFHALNTPQRNSRCTTK